MTIDDRTIEDRAARQIIERLGLRRTTDRLETFRAFLAFPGLSAAALSAMLAGRGVDIHRRTVYRALAVIWSPEGCRARWDLVGPVWVCWGCGQALASARGDPAIARLLDQGLLPLDLGGYCAHCQESLDRAQSENATVVPSGLRKGRAASAVANRRTSIIPVGALYQNPGLLRELLGSERRLMRRDYVVANLAENPRVGPSTVHLMLRDELPIVPTLRSVKRVSGALHGPKAKLLFASLGVAGWSCPSCAAWGAVSDPASLHDGAPEGFFPTDLRGLCARCRQQLSS